MFIGIFYHNYSGINNNAYGKGNAGERHDIGRYAEGVKKYKAGSDRDYGLYNYYKGALPVENKNQDDDGYTD